MATADSSMAMPTRRKSVGFMIKKLGRADAVEMARVECTASAHKEDDLTVSEKGEYGRSSLFI